MGIGSIVKERRARGAAKGMTATLGLLVIGLLTAGVNAEERADDAAAAERERQAAFRAGFAVIVESLNAGSFDEFVAAIDREDLVERIFGLRLIDQKVKRQFRERLKYDFDGLIRSAFGSADDGIIARLLGFESRADRGRAVVRLDLPDFQFNYHEYELRLDAAGGVVIVDWTDFLQGERFTDGIGMSLIRSAPGKPAVRKLLDFQNVRERDLFQMTELLKAARDRQLDRYNDILGDLDERLQRQRVVVLTSVQLAIAVRNRRQQRTALAAMARHFPEEPLYSLMLLDYYFPTRRYDEAFGALERLHERLRVDDAAMQARLSAAALVLNELEQADAYANAALELERDLELAWWSALRSRTALDRYDDAVAALSVLEDRFGHSLGPDALGKDRFFVRLLASAPYRDWVSDRD